MKQLRTYCGDCLEVLAKLDPEEANFILTDPPFGVTDNKWDSIIPIEELWFLCLRASKGNAAIALHSCQPFTSLLISSRMELFRYCWTWNKMTRPTGFMNAKRQPLRIIEEVCVFSEGPHNYYPQMSKGPVQKWTSGNRTESKNYGRSSRTAGNRDQRYPVNLLHIPRDKVKRDGSNHPTRKPVALAEYLIKTYTRPGDVVLDFTMGSGTTGVAALRLGRKFIGIEKDPEIYRMAVERLQSSETSRGLFE